MGVWPDKDPVASLAPASLAPLRVVCSLTALSATCEVPSWTCEFAWCKDRPNSGHRGTSLRTSWGTSSLALDILSPPLWNCSLPTSMPAHCTAHHIPCSSASQTSLFVCQNTHSTRSGTGCAFLRCSSPLPILGLALHPVHGPPEAGHLHSDNHTSLTVLSDSGLPKPMSSVATRHSVLQDAPPPAQLFSSGEALRPALPKGPGKLPLSCPGADLQALYPRHTAS